MTANASSSNPLPDHPVSGSSAPNPNDPHAVPALFELTSHFRHWRFSKAELTAIRKETNVTAIKNARKNLALEAQLQGQEDTFDADDISFFTPEEEIEWVNLCCSLPPMLCKLLELSPLVQATSIAFIKRFYLYKSVIDYEIKAVMTTCIFLASKVENNRVDLSKLLTRIKGLDAGLIKDLEFTIADVLQYEFWVRHPFDPALGIYLDYQAAIQHHHQPPLDVSTQLLDDTWRHTRALLTKAIATDAVLLYMPAQIALGCWLAAARRTGLPFEREFVHVKVPDDTQRAQLMDVLEDVIALLASAAPPDRQRQQQLAAKRQECCNPEFNPEAKLFMVRSDERKRREVVEEDGGKAAGEDGKAMDPKTLRAVADALDEASSGAESKKRKADEDEDSQQGPAKRVKTEPGQQVVEPGPSSDKVKQEPQ